MKLRIKGDSLRIRVTQGELDQFTSAGQVEEAIHFGADRALTYRLTRDPKASQLAASFDHNTIDVRIPEHSAREWSETNLVTLENKEAALKIFVEKDFACLQPREGEDESDHFPNPAAGTGATC